MINVNYEILIERIKNYQPIRKQQLTYPEKAILYQKLICKFVFRSTKITTKRFKTIMEVKEILNALDKSLREEFVKNCKNYNLLVFSTRFLIASISSIYSRCSASRFPVIALFSCNAS